MKRLALLVLTTVTLLQAEGPLNKEMDMKSRVEKRNPVKVLYLRKVGKNYAALGESSWSELKKFAATNGLLGRNTKMYGISHSDPATQTELIYDACISIDRDVALTKENKEAGFGIQTIEGGDYLVVQHKGDCSTVMKTYQYAYGQAVQKHGKKARRLPPIEVYRGYNPEISEAIETDVCIPVE